MRTFTEDEAGPEMEKWWRKLQPGDQVTKVLAPLDYSESFAQVASCRAWCEGDVVTSTRLLFSETRDIVRRAYADLAAERIAAGVQVTRIVLMDTDALEAERPGWRDWLIEQQLRRLIIPLTGERVYCLPIAEFGPEVNLPDMDVNVFGSLGVMHTFYSAGNVSHRKFYYQAQPRDRQIIGDSTIYVTGARHNCEDRHRVWPVEPLEAILDEAAAYFRAAWSEREGAQVLDFSGALHEAFAHWAPTPEAQAGLLEALRVKNIQPARQLELSGEQTSSWVELIAAVVHHTLHQELGRRNPDLARLNQSI